MQPADIVCRTLPFTFWNCRLKLLKDWNPHLNAISDMVRSVANNNLHTLSIRTLLINSNKVMPQDILNALHNAEEVIPDALATSSTERGLAYWL